MSKKSPIFNNFLKNIFTNKNQKEKKPDEFQPNPEATGIGVHDLKNDKKWGKIEK